MGADCEVSKTGELVSLVVGRGVCGGAPTGVVVLRPPGRVDGDSRTGDFVDVVGVKTGIVDVTGVSTAEVGVVTGSSSDESGVVGSVTALDGSMTVGGELGVGVENVMVEF